MSTEEKHRIRQFARAARQAIPAEDRPVLAASLAGRLTMLPEFSPCPCVAGYLATAEEIDPAPALRSLASRGCLIVYPRITGPGALVFHEIGGEWNLEAGPHGILQPSLDTPIVAKADIGVVLLPGVAFGPDGARIGFGGGYYDRLLQEMPDAVRIGLAFDEQLVGHIPAEEHDIAVEMIVTPTQVLRIAEAY